MAEESHTIGGFGRADHFSYTQRFGGAGEVAGHVLVEAGTASGREPTAARELRSYLSGFLGESGLTLGAEDEAPFTMPLLHFRRTFVEKLFAIHGKVELLKREGRPVGSYARHYYDLFQLAAETEVHAMLASQEYADIRADDDAISRASFPQNYFAPEEMSFSKSDAIFPVGELAGVLAKGYDEQCRLLCLGPYPSWEQGQSRLEDLRGLL